MAQFSASLRHRRLSISLTQLTGMPALASSLNQSGAALAGEVPSQVCPCPAKTT